MTYSDIEQLIADNLASGNKIPAVKHREVEFALLNYIQENLFQTGDIKAIKCDVDYLADNFELDGTGKNLRLGWRILLEASGRTLVSLGGGYSLGETGGSKTTTLTAENIPELNVILKRSTNTSGGVGDSLVANVTNNGGTLTAKANASNTPTAINKEMPYFVILYIEKI